MKAGRSFLRTVSSLCPVGVFYCVSHLHKHTLLLAPCFCIFALIFGADFAPNRRRRVLTNFTCCQEFSSDKVRKKGISSSLPNFGNRMIFSQIQAFRGFAKKPKYRWEWLISWAQIFKNNKQVRKESDDQIIVKKFMNTKAFLIFSENRRYLLIFRTQCYQFFGAWIFELD